MGYWSVSHRSRSGRGCPKATGNTDTVKEVFSCTGRSLHGSLARVPRGTSTPAPRDTSRNNDGRGPSLSPDPSHTTDTADQGTPDTTDVVGPTVPPAEGYGSHGPTVSLDSRWRFRGSLCGRVLICVVARLSRLFMGGREGRGSPLLMSLLPT